MAPVCCVSDDDDGPMSLGCCGPSTSVVSNEQKNKAEQDDDTYLEVSSDSSNSENKAGCSDKDDASVGASVVTAVSDLVTGQLALDIGTEIVRSASEVLFGPCQQELQILRDIDFDGATEASSLYTDDTDDAEDMTLTGFVRIRRSFGRSTSSARKQFVEPVEEEEVPETSVAEKAERYANALAALQQKQAEALEEHHRLKEEEHAMYAAPAPISSRKPSVAEQVLLEADEEDCSLDMPSDESDSLQKGMIATETHADQDDGFPEPMVVHQIISQSSTDAQDMSVTNVLPSDFVPFWAELSTTTQSSPEDFTPAWLKLQEEEEEAKSHRKKKNKLSKIVPSFLRKRTMNKKM